jgi:hypothetical protein
MISPREIETQCLGWWKGVLIDTVLNRLWVPREITRIGKIMAKDILMKLPEYRDAIGLLSKHAKGVKPFGYRLEFAERQFDKIGLQPVPSAVVIDTLDDYLYITGKKAEFRTFNDNLKLIISRLPALLDWVVVNPLRLIEHDTWEDTLKVCEYFLRCPRPNLYVRQLPIDVHTKYIFDNKPVITSLLNFLIPEYINASEKDFEQRFNLLSKEQLIRIRFLDPSVSPLSGITDISFTEKELNEYPIAVDNVFLTENLMNFLTLPKLRRTIAIWSGGGFNVSYLRNIAWLQDMQFFYWGDIDAQGFQILSQCRRYFQNTVSVMMDINTLESFPTGKGTPAKELPLINLTVDELLVYQLVVKDNVRLEQEKITQQFADSKISKLLHRL